MRMRYKSLRFFNVSCTPERASTVHLTKDSHALRGERPRGRDGRPPCAGHWRALARIRAALATDCMDRILPMGRDYFFDGEGPKRLDSPCPPISSSVSLPAAGRGSPQA